MLLIVITENLGLLTQNVGKNGFFGEHFFRDNFFKKSDLSASSGRRRSARDSRKIAVTPLDDTASAYLDIDTMNS